MFTTCGLPVFICLNSTHESRTLFEITHKLVYIKELNALIRTGIYRDTDDVLQDALNTFLALKSNIRLEMAIELFKNEEVSLLRAAEIARINFYIFKNILKDRLIEIPIEIESSEEMDNAIEKFKKMVNS